jgi:hypothetical protein
MSRPNVSKSAPPGLVTAHYAAAAIALLLLTALMFFSAEAFIGHYFHPKLLAITHISILGWASMIIFGALYQFLPVILVTDLFSVGLGKATFVLFITGISFLAYSFWSFNTGMLIQTGAVLLFIGTTLFVINIIATTLKAKEENIETDFIVSSVVWFWLTVLIGSLLAFNFQYAFLEKEHLEYLKIHAHIGITGWFLLLIIGVSARLIPMFLLSSSVSNKRLKYSLYIINATLIIFLIDSFIFNGINRSLIYFIMIISGIIIYISFIYRVFKQRARKLLDINMKQSLLAFIIIGIPVISGFIVNSGWIADKKLLLQITLIYGVSIFIGFISLLILGQTFKTLPFIIWLKLTKKEGRTEKVPLPKDLYQEKLIKWQSIIYILGLLILFTGILFSSVILIKTGCALLFSAAFLYNINVFKLLIYK